MKFCLPIVRYAPPLIIEISIFTKMVRIRASPPSASRAASSYPARKFSNNFPKFENVAKFWKVQNLQNRAPRRRYLKLGCSQCYCLKSASIQPRMSPLKIFTRANCLLESITCTPQLEPRTVSLLSRGSFRGRLRKNFCAASTAASGTPPFDPEESPCPACVCHQE